MTHFVQYNRLLLAFYKDDRHKHMFIDALTDYRVLKTFAQKQQHYNYVQDDSNETMHAVWALMLEGLNMNMQTIALSIIQLILTYMSAIRFYEWMFVLKL